MKPRYPANFPETKFVRKRSLKFKLVSSIAPFKAISPFSAGMEFEVYHPVDKTVPNLDPAVPD
jgi:hypothetical protein